MLYFVLLPLNSNLVKRNQYSEEREALLQSTTSQTITKDGLVAAQVTSSSAGANIIIFVNGIPRFGSKSNSGTPVSVYGSVDVVAGDKISYSTYGTCSLDVCWLYPKL